jgi:hypothetical protein
MAQRRPYAPHRPDAEHTGPVEREPLARTGEGQPTVRGPRRRAAPARPELNPVATPPVAGELQLGPAEVLLSLPVAIGVGQMLIDGSLDALPWVATWTGVVAAYKTITAPGVRRGSLDWLVDSIGVGGELRRRLGVPDELPVVATPSRARGAWGFFDGLTADVRNLKAAVAARRGEIVEGVYHYEDEPPPAARRAAAIAPPARAARSVGGVPAEDIDGPDDERGEDVPDIGLPVVRIEDIANLDNLWVVGPKNSGKTTTVQALIRMRRGQHIALDPHGTPGKWPGCEMVGAGRDFAAIDQQINRFISWMDKRYKRMGVGELTEEQCKAARRTMVGDEWRAIRTALPGSKGGRGGKPVAGAAERLLDILTEGRKAGICVLTASHLDTAEGMGISGEKDILKCFDMIIYLGAMATKYVPAAAAMPRPAVVYDPEHNVWAQLIIGQIAAEPAPAAPDLEDEADEQPVAKQALSGVVPCDACGQPTPRAGRYCIVCAAPQHSGGDNTAPLVIPEPEAASPSRQRKVAAAEGGRPAVVSVRLPEPASDPLLAGLLAGEHERRPAATPASEDDIFARLSPERAARLRAIQAAQPAASPAPAPAEEPPPPVGGQSVTVEHPDGHKTIVNVWQASSTRYGRGRRAPGRGGLKAKKLRARADGYRKVREVIARGGSANEARREAQIGRDKALSYARQARAELGLAAANDKD